MGALFPSPDGSKYAIAGAWGSVTLLDIERGTLLPLPLDGAGGGGGFLGWHPDNQRVLYRHDGGDQAGLWLVGPGSVTVLVRELSAAAIRDAAVSPDGNWLVYSDWRGFGSAAELRLQGINDLQHTVLYTGEADIFAISWSPDGRHIAFFGDQGYMVTGADGTSLRTLDIQLLASQPFVEPVWSPDGRQIAYVAQLPIERQATEAVRLPLAETSIRLIDVNTGTERPLLDDNYLGDFDPAWSPDGSHLVFVSLRTGTSELWIVNIDGTGLRQLSAEGVLIRAPIWQQLTKGS